MEYLLPAKCRADIYDVDSRESWVECANLRAYYGLAWSIGLLVVIILLLIVFWFSPTLFFAGVIVALLVAAAAINYGFWAEMRAGGDYDTYMVEFERIQKDNPGFNRGQVNKEIKDERLKREEIKARKDAANTHANATFASALTLADALRSPRRFK